MNKILARDLISKPIEEVMSILPRHFTLVFDDGEIETTDRQTIYSRVFWKFHQEYPKTPILIKHHVKSVLDGKPLNADTHLKLATNIFKDTYNYNGFTRPEQQDRLQELVCETVNELYNLGSQLSLEYVSSVDLSDFIEIIEHPGIKLDGKKKIKSHKDVENLYNKAISVMTSDEGLKNNSIVKALKAKMVNKSQVLQCCVARGFQTEVSGDIFRFPITSSYARGMRKLYDFVAESRTAEKAYRFSESPLQQSEYFARRLQLLTSPVEHIEYVDCGSTNYVEWYVKPPVYDEFGIQEYQGDLPNLIGKYYLDPADPSRLLEITEKDLHLVGTTIKLRSVIFCKHGNPHNICSTCFGALSKNIDIYSNVGHMCSALMTQQTSQKVLSTKHVDASSVSVNIVIPKEAQLFLETNPERNVYLVKKYLKDKHPVVTFMRDEVLGLMDLIMNDDAENVNIRRISSINTIEMKYEDKGRPIVDMLSVSVGSRKAIISKEMLDYIKTGKWSTDDKNNFVVDLSEWTFDTPFLVLPDKEYNYSEHAKQIAEIIESSGKKFSKRIKAGAKQESISSILVELFDLVNAKLNVNLACLEVLLYAASQRGHDDYMLSRNSDTPVLGMAHKIIKGRSLSAALAYEHMSNTISSPESFFVNDRPDSVFDVFIDPQAVLNKQNCC